MISPRFLDCVVSALYSDEATASTIAEAQADPCSRFLVVENNNRVAGLLHYYELGPEPELHRIYVRPDASSAGAGSGLMRALHDTLAPDKSYVLPVAAGNTRAIALCERHDLTIRETVDGADYYRAAQRVTAER